MAIRLVSAHLCTSSKQITYYIYYAKICFDDMQRCADTVFFISAVRPRPQVLRPRPRSRLQSNVITVRRDRPRPPVTFYYRGKGGEEAGVYQTIA